MEKKALTSQFPVLIVGSANSGKTYAIEQLPKEEKARCIVFNFDSKPIEGDYAAVFAFGSDMEVLEQQLAALPADAKEYREHYTRLLNTSYFVDDPEAIDKIVAHILKATFSVKIDTIVLDTFAGLLEFTEAWSKKNAPDSRSAWGLYGNSLQTILQAFKEATIFGFKMVYINVHHDEIPAISYATTPKQVVKVAGNIMKGSVEKSFNTIIYSHRIEDGTIMYSCDNLNTLDTSRTKLKEGSFSFARTCLNEIPLYLNGLATIKDFKLIPKKGK